jgi:hypothetical protein
VTSKYPVILSIENHCDLAQQEVMARTFTDILGGIDEFASLSLILLIALVLVWDLISVCFGFEVISDF